MCWNRQTGTFEGRVSVDVWVQVPSSAPEKFKVDAGSESVSAFFCSQVV